MSPLSFASSFSFLGGALIPLLAILLPPEPLRVPFTFFSVLIALILTGVISARIGEANVLKATIRVVLGGAIAMIATYGVGRLFGIKGI